MSRNAINFCRVLIVSLALVLISIAIPNKSEAAQSCPASPSQSGTGVPSVKWQNWDSSCRTSNGTEYAYTTQNFANYFTYVAPGRGYDFVTWLPASAGTVTGSAYPAKFGFGSGGTTLNITQVSCAGSTTSAVGTYFVFVTLSSNTSCSLQITAGVAANAVTYSSTLSFDGTSYTVSQGNLSGGQYGAADSAPPVVQSSAISGSPAPNSTSVNYLVTFDETANNISSDDFVLTTTGTSTGTISSVSATSGTTSTVTVNSISGNGTLRLDVKASTNIIDASGNGNATNGYVTAFTSGSTHSTIFDTSPPAVQTIAISGSPTNMATEVDFVITFDEAVSNVSTDDFQLTKTATATGTVASVSASSGTSVTIRVNSISGIGTLRLDLEASTNIIDASGNGNGTNGSVAAFASGSTHTVSFDTFPPIVQSIAISGSPAVSATEVDFIVTFNENTKFLDTNDFGLTTTGTATGTIASVSSSSGTSIIVKVNAISGNGTLRLDLLSPKDIQDDEGNGSGNNGFVAAFTSGSIHTVTTDTTGPVVTMTGVSESISNTDPFTVTYSFNEDVGSTFDVSDVTAALSNATASGFATVQANVSFTVVITPTGGGDVSVGLNAGAVTDADGNKNLAATPQVATSNIVEETQKMVANFVQNRKGNILSVQPNISGFVDGTFGQGGGSLGNFGLRANANGFTTKFNTSLGRVWGEMAKNQAAALRTGSANAPTAQTSYIAPTVQQAANRVAQAHAVATAKIGDDDRAPGSETADADAQAENIYASTLGLNDSENLSQTQQRGYDIWMQVYGAKSEVGSSDSSVWVGYVGGHAHINQNLLVGMMLQADWSDESDDAAGSSADGFGWMVGPYFAAKVPGQNLFFDARAAWGRSDNKVKPIGTYEDDFETERWLLSAKVSGLFRHQGISIRPAVSVSYFEETQEAYTDSLTNTIAAQTFSQGEVSFGPTFSYDISQDNGMTLRPKFGVSGVWNFAINNGANSQGAVLGTGDIRARLDAGFSVVEADSWSLDLMGFYDGIGINDYQSYGGRARVTIPLQ